MSDKKEEKDLDLTKEDLAKEESKDLTEKSKDLKPKVNKLEELENKLSSLEDKYLRTQAEMINMQNRLKKEQEQLLKYEGQSFIKAILPAMDNLRRALEIKVSGDDAKQLKKGIEMVENNLKVALDENDVTKIDALGNKFDPTLHQAVQTVEAESEDKKDTIVQVFQDGYMLKDRVLRPAMVVVAQ